MAEKPLPHRARSLFGNGPARLVIRDGVARADLSSSLIPVEVAA